MTAPNFVVSAGPVSSYSFRTHQGQPAGVAIATKLNLAGVTLKLEFDHNSRFPAPVEAGSVTYTPGSVNIALSAEEVDRHQDAYFRIQVIGSDFAYYLLNGSVDYTEADVESALLDENGLIRTQFLPFDALDDVFLLKSEYAGAGGLSTGSVQTMIDTTLQAHEQDATPHKAYDVDMPSLTLLFENKLI